MASSSHFKLGILLGAQPDSPNFMHGIALAKTALQRNFRVYLYCIDDAVAGLSNLLELQSMGANIFACAHSAQIHRVSPAPSVALSGLTVLSDIMADTDRFVSLL